MSEDRVLPSLAKSTDEYMAAFELSNDGYLEEAEKHARKSIEIKKNIDALILLIDILERQNKDSTNYQKTLLEEYPTNPDTYRRLFQSNFTSNKDEALTYINRAINLLKKPVYYYDKARLLYSMERHLEALASIDMAIKMENRNTSFWNLRAEILLKLQRVNDARESCGVSLKIDQRNRDAIVTLSRIYINSGEKGTARDLLLKVDERDDEIKKLLEETIS
ncbi:MAG: tetratricopeptide repeat protein [Thermoplasmata archaeon]